MKSDQGGIKRAVRRIKGASRSGNPLQALGKEVAAGDP
jgi:hypothetical protein